MCLRRKKKPGECYPPGSVREARFSYAWSAMADPTFAAYGTISMFAATRFATSAVVMLPMITGATVKLPSAS